MNEIIPKAELQLTKIIPKAELQLTKIIFQVKVEEAISRRFLLKQRAEVASEPFQGGFVRLPCVRVLVEEVGVHLSRVRNKR